MGGRKNRARFRKWSAEEDALLAAWVREHGPRQWSACCRRLANRSATQCRERWKNSLDPSIKKGDWSEAEDLQLFLSLRKHLFSWKKVSLDLEGRTRISCRNRFYNSVKNLARRRGRGLFRALLLERRVRDHGTQRFCAALRSGKKLFKFFLRLEHLEI